MKKLFILIPLCAALCGCDSGNNDAYSCDAGLIWEFVVENGLGDREIVITSHSIYSGYDTTISLEPEGSETVSHLGTIGPCGMTEVMDDYLHGNDFRIIPYGYNLVDEDYHDLYFVMTIDGVEVSSEIWRRKYWTFEPGIYDSFYTLTVTDELLASLPQPEVPESE